jgi:hypothetical protein
MTHIHLKTQEKIVPRCSIARPISTRINAKPRKRQYFQCLSAKPSPKENADPRHARDRRTLRDFQFTE